MRKFEERALGVAAQTAKEYANHDAVIAVVLGGSYGANKAEPGSDIDLYVYARPILPISFREQVANAHSSYAEVNNTFFESGDEWIDADTDVHVDVMFRDPGWIEDDLDWVLGQHQASMGYTTCMWYNVLFTHILYDRKGWYAELQEKARIPYPESLRKAVINKNYDFLRKASSSYLYQITSAVNRQDWVSVNHRTAALLASYFDIIFAFNRLPHPGEKRMLETALTECGSLPVYLGENIQSLLGHATSPEILEDIKTLLDRLDAMLGKRIA